VLTLILLLIGLTGLDHRLLAGQAGAVSVSLAEALSYVILTLLMLAFVVAPRTKRHAFSAALRASNVFIVLYFGWLFIAGLLNVVAFAKTDGLHDLKDAMPGFILYWAMLAVVDRRARLRAAHVAVLVTLATMSTLGIVQATFGGPYLNPIDEKAFLKTTLAGTAPVGNPVVATLGHPNAFALFLAPLLVLTVGFLAYYRKVAMKAAVRVLAYGLLLLSFSTLFLTQAKAPIAWCVLGTVLMIVVVRSRLAFSVWRSLGITAVAVAAVVGAVALLVVAGQQIPESAPIGTVVTRLILNYQVLDWIPSNHVGLVFGGVVKDFEAYSGLDLGVHNEYVSQLLRYGLPGAVLFIGLMARAISIQARPGWLYSLPLITLALIYMLESASGSQLQTVLFLLAGFADCHSRVTNEERDTKWNRLPAIDSSST